MDTGNNPFAPPQAEVADVAVAGQPELAGRGQRFFAAIIDVVVQVAVLGVVSWLLPFSLLRPDASAGIGTIVRNGAIGFVVFLLLNGWLLARRSQTLGKAALGLRIVRPDGSRAEPARLFVQRYGIGALIAMVPLVNVLYGLADALLIFRAPRRCLHDYIADTIVVRARSDAA